MTYVYDQATDTWITKGRTAIAGTGNLGAPVAAMTFTASALVCNFDASASAQKGGTITAYAWDFGDGSTGTGKTPSHTYAAAGTYAVKLTVTGSSTLQTQATYSVSVTAAASNPVPAPDFTFVANNSADPLRVNFDASTSTISGGSIVKYDWDFQQSTYSSTSPLAPGYYYNSPGTFTVKLTVTSDKGVTASKTKQVVVNAVNQPPVPKITSATASGAVVNVAAAVTDSDGYVASVSWNWGDGTAATAYTGGTSTKQPQMTASHTYASSGPFTVTLTATDDKGATAAITASVNPVIATTPPPNTSNAAKSPWTTGSVTEGLPSSVAVYKARSLQPSGALELQTLINALPGPGVIDISGQEVNISSFANPNLSGASGSKWRGLIGGMTNGQFDNQLLVGHNVMSESIRASIEAQQTAYTTSQYAAVRLANGTPPFYWMGVHAIGADQGQVNESSSAQVSPAPARYKGLDFDTSGSDSILQNSLFEGFNSGTGSRPPWEVGALDFRRSTRQVVRRVEVSGILPIGSKSRPNASTADPYNRGWKRSGGIQFNADKSPRLTDVSLHDALTSGLTFSIAGTGNNSTNNTEDIQGTRLYLENNSAFGFACINNEVVLGPVSYDHCTFKSPGSNPHIKIANNTGFGSVAPNIPTDSYVVNEPTWSGGAAGAMLHIAISTAAQTSMPKVVKNGVTLAATNSTGQDPAKYYYVQKV